MLATQLQSVGLLHGLDRSVELSPPLCEEWQLVKLESVNHAQPMYAPTPQPPYQNLA